MSENQNDNQQKEEIVQEQSVVQQTNEIHYEQRSNFFSKFMSVDETRVSVLMICLLASLLFSMYAYLSNGDISANFVSIVETFIYCVTGINVASAFTGGQNSTTNKIGNAIKNVFNSSNNEQRR